MGTTNLQIAIVDPLDADKHVKKRGKPYEWGEIVNGCKIYVLHEGQIDVLKSTAKFVGAFAGAQGGKTACAPLWMKKRIEDVLTKPSSNRPKGEPPRGLFVSPTVPMRQQSQIVQHLERYYSGTTYAGKYVKNESIFRFANQQFGEILFRTADNPASLDGGVYDYIVVDEAAKKEYSLECWQRIQTRAAARNAPVLVVSTPDMASPIYDAFYSATKPMDSEDKQRKSDDGEWYMRRWESICRPGFNLKAFDEAKRTMPSVMFDRMFRGVFSRFEGLVYEQFGDDKVKEYPVYRNASGVVAEIERLPSPAVRIIGGQDFGYTNDPAVSLLGVECENGVIYVVDECYQTGLNNDQLAAEVLKIEKRWTISRDFKYAELLQSTRPVWYCDREDPKAIDALRSYGISARPYHKDLANNRTASIMTVAAMFKAGRLIISARCKNLISEAKRYAWKQDRSGDYIDEPVGKDDHAMDSLRYLCASHMVGKKITPLNPDDSLSVDDKHIRDIEAANRLGIISDDGTAAATALKEQEALNQKRLEYAAAWGDLDDNYYR